MLLVLPLEDVHVEPIEQLIKCRAVRFSAALLEEGCQRFGDRKAGDERADEKWGITRHEAFKGLKCGDDRVATTHAPLTPQPHHHRARWQHA
eukprot:5763024-Prymnesium_polylepis.3